MVSIAITFLRHLNLVALERVLNGVGVLGLTDVGHLLGEVTDGRNWAEERERDELYRH